MSPGELYVLQKPVGTRNGYTPTAFESLILTALALVAPGAVPKNWLMELLGVTAPYLIDQQIKLLRRRSRVSILEGPGGLTLTTPSDLDNFRRMVNLGNAASADQDWQSSLEYFKNALELWGTGPDAQLIGHLRTPRHEIDRLAGRARLAAMRCMLSLEPSAGVSECATQLKVPPDEMNNFGIAHSTLQLTHRGDIGAAQAYLDTQHLHSSDTAETQSWLAELLAPPRAVQQTDSLHVIQYQIPPATYTHYIPRPEVEDAVRRALDSDIALTILAGIGGNGKSVVAHHTAVHQLGSIRFECVLWVSDRQRPGRTTLDSLLAQLAVVTGSSTLGTGDLEQRARLAIHFMTQRATLLIVDNFETITDSSLFAWLGDVASPSKVLLTTIRVPTEISAPYTLVPVTPLTESQALELATQYLERNGLSTAGARSYSAALFSLCAGNARLLEWALGQSRVRGLQATVSHIRAASSPENSPASEAILQQLLRDSWDKLTKEAHLVLLAIAHFPYGVGGAVARQVLSSPESFYEHLQALVDCFFVRIAYEDDLEPIYVPDALARQIAFSTANNEEGATVQLSNEWLGQWVEYVRGIGFCPGDVERLSLLDDERVRLNLQFALEHAVRTENWEFVSAVTRDVRYWYYCRGLWSSKPNVFDLRMLAARALGDSSECFDACVYYANIQAKQQNAARALELVSEAKRLEGPYFLPNPKQLCELRHAEALAHLATGNLAGLRLAADLWRENLQHEADLGPENFNANLRWLAQCLAQIDPATYADETATLLDRALSQSLAENYRRAELMTRLSMLEREARDQSLNRNEVAARAEDLRPLVSEIRDPIYGAQHQWITALLKTGPARAVALEEAAVLYERLGQYAKAQAVRSDMGIR